MRLRIYLAVLIATAGLLGVSSIPRPALRPAFAPLRAIGALQPVISPDGATIAFACQGAIWRIPRAGGVMKRLTADPAWDSDPAWAPDGKSIACISGGEISILDAETGARRLLGAKVQARGSLKFHPDGRRILFGEAARGGLLSWFHHAGGVVRRVLDPPGGTIAAVSPDGKEFAYVVHQDVAGEQSGNNGPQADVWIRPDEEGAPRKLVRFPSRIFGLAWREKSLIAVSDLGGAHNDLWEIPLDAPEKPRKWTSGQADEDSPSAAGSWLVYTDNREGPTAMVVRDLATGGEQTVVVTGMDTGRPQGTLSLRFVEKGTGKPLAVRAAIQEENGKPIAPPGSLYRIHDQMDFSAGDAVEFAAPVGKYHLHASHGPEYRQAHAQAEVAEGKKTELTVELERWADPQSRGWYGGENHIHANYGYGQWYSTPDEMRRMVEAEGLNVANFVVANSDTDGVFDREFFRGRPDPASSAQNVLYWNEEFRATLWGHLTLVNLKKLVEPIFTGFADTTNPWDVPTNSDLADHVHLQGGHVNYTHPASNPKDPYLGAYSAKSLPLDVALGKIDSMDINGSFEAAVPLWYRLLNCGFRLPASAGTDCFLNRVRSRLPGSDRAYVKIDGEFSYEAWIRGLKAGRSFVTNGPLIEFDAGRTIKLDGPGDVDVKATASAAIPIDRAEVVVNGERQAPLAASGNMVTIDTKIRMEKSGWIAIRVVAGRQQAHSSPIYAEVAGKPAGSKDDARYFLEWIDRLEAQLRARRRIPSDELSQHVGSQLAAGREVYRRIAARE